MATGNRVEREFDFNPEHFKHIRGVLYDLTGIKLGDSKDSLVYSRLSRRLRTLRINNFDDYIALLNKDPKETEFFINGLTTNLTSFFREKHHFDFLIKYLQDKNTEISIWCCACSTGEEPYSLAMSACEAFNSYSPPVSIIATDIDSNVIQSAKQGIYTEDRIDSISDDYRKKYFYKGKNNQQGKVKVVDELKTLITYSKLNLTHRQWQVSGPFDIVFCRNVMIYFDRETQLNVFSRLVSNLKPSGLYFAGHSESFLSSSKLVKPVGRTIYKRSE